jgi:NAD(P)-dependent dehydrogenase (short-subunit alcohol dehydrogenase family)|tara:strand:- start:2931 stop:3608 length:678 start_codon:yes stop_codon:yes gene_type:complete
MKKLVITGGEGLIGTKLKEYFKDKFEVLSLDISLGHDLTDEDFVKKFFAKNKNLYGLIVLHAYNPLPLKNTTKIEPIDYSLNEIKDYLNVNVISAFDVCRNFIKNNKKGRIINVSSLYGEVSPKHHIYDNFTKHIGYSLSKSSVVMMTKYLATYYPDFNINTVILGGVYQEDFDVNFVKRYNENTPLKRMMNVNEVTSCFDFLLKEESSYVTGTEIKVDGGWTAW